MKIPTRRRGSGARGQALIEFAVILPILMLLLLLAIDFGRVFFGWVGLHNAVRIAANEAGFQPQAWNDPVWVELQDVYRAQVLHEVQGINCAPPGGGSWATDDIPAPTYIDQPGTPTTDEYEIGDHTTVAMTCEFSFLTPFLGMVIGNPMPISASAEFPVKGGRINDVPVLPEPSASLPPVPTCTAPQLYDVGLRVNSAPSEYTAAGFTGDVIVTRPPSGNYVIGNQDLVAGQEYDCTVDIIVYPGT